ncbi:MAG: type II CRISPR RNA-guided endonuclease Cas9, partial [Clostridiales bacterium]|nr:type II CRISPR RNA-guided endonuclease Cas9 [Clostridiales bacterium]
YKELKAAISSEIQGLEFPKEGKDFDWEGTNLSREDMEFLERISKSMEFDTYLLKQRISDNGAIPYQVHEYELIKIIEKQGKYYPFLLEKSGEDYIIQSLMKFRIPYFVGPLVQADKGDDGKKYSDKSNFAWLQKKSSDKITPWNFDDVVDRDASGVEFIERMTSYCTYLPDEKVLPKNSLLYQEFCVYNELITSGYYLEGSRQKNYFGEAFTREIVTQLFQKKKKVYQDDVIKFLYNEKHITTTELFGIDKKSVNGKPSFNSSMSTFIDLTKMGIKAETISDNRDLFDEIVKWQTIFTDKKSLQARIKSANQEWQILTDVQAEKLSNKHYKGFGNLSKKLIDGIRDERTNKTIIELLKEAGYDNFMRLVSGATAERYSFKKVIEEAQTKALDKGITYEVVDELAGSPKVKKGIWQSLQIIKELEGFLGRENISRIVIEMSKGPDGGRTKSRYKKTKELYDKFEEKNKDVYDELKQYEKNESALNNEKLYLYFMQNGKDAYTGTKLDIMELPHYEVDHIVPQCFIKDDSVDNKVLVSRKSNQDKGGDVPSSVVVKRMKSIWSLWEKAGLISAKKFKNLTTGSLTDKVKEGFINRQLVENRQ